MVAVVSGNGLGLTTSSRSILGGGGALGNATDGRSGEQAYVNTATGNLVIQDRDEYLTGIGIHAPLIRTYNSQGLLTDDNGDNWRLGVHERLSAVNGTLNAAGSYIVKTFGDGAEVRYNYNTSLAKYVSTDGDGAHDTLAYNSSASQWTWTDGSSRATETYDSSGRLISSRDQDGNVRNYTYTGALLTSITDSSSPVQTTFFDYTGNNLTAIRVVSNGVTQTLTRYTYDSQNRLSQVRVDLSPGDNAITDGKVFLTTYTYDGTSTRVLTISQGDGVNVGSTVSFTYQLLDGLYRVKTFTDAEGRVSTYTYTTPSGSSGSTTATANSGALSTTEQQTSTNTYNLNNGALTGGASVNYNPIYSGVPVTNLSGAAGGWTYYAIEVPSGSSELFVKSSGGLGDVDFYVRRGALPTDATYDYAGDLFDVDDEAVFVANPVAGTYYIGVKAFTAISGVTLMASVQSGTTSTRTLTANSPVYEIHGDGTAATEHVFSFTIPSGTTNFRLTLSGNNGDAELLLKQGAVPTLAAFDYQSNGPDSNEAITVTSPTAGTWYAVVHTSETASEASLVLHTNVGANVPATVDAGAGKSVASGASVTLGGTATAPSGTVTYQWSQVSGTAVTLSGATTASPTFTAPSVSTPTTLVFKLTATVNGVANSDIVRVVVGAPAPVTPPSNWTAPVALESSSTAATQLVAADNNGGRTIAVWEQGGALYATTYDVAAHTWSTPVVVSGTLTTPTSVKLSSDYASGNAILTWRDSATGQVRANRYVLNTTSGAYEWQGSELIVTITGTAVPISDISGSINVTGQAAVVWRESNAGTQTVKVRRRAGSASAWAAEESVASSTGTLDQVQLAVNSGNRIQVIWRSSSGTGYRVTARAFVGSAWGTQVNINSAVANVSQIRVDTDPSGDVNVFWLEGLNVCHNWGNNTTWNGMVLLGTSPAAVSLLSVNDSNQMWMAAIATVDGDIYIIHGDSEEVEYIGHGSAISELQMDGNDQLGAVVTWRDGNDLYALRYIDHEWRGGQVLETASGATSNVYGFVSANNGTATDNQAVAVWLQNDGTANSVFFSRYEYGIVFNGGAPYYNVQSGDTWSSIAQTLYGSSTAAAQLQTALGNPTLTAGLHLTGMPSTLTVTTTSTVTVPAYYTVPASATWTTITQAIYGTSDANAVAALQAATGNPTLTTGLHLTVPLTLTYTAAGSGGGSTVYLQTDITDNLGLVTSFVNDASGRLTGILSPTTGGARLETRYAYDADGNVASITEDPAGLNRTTTFQYDSNGNLTLTRDALGNTITRTFSANNQPLTETRYTVPDPDGAGGGQPSGPLTTRYAYDTEDHLRFVISADGRVTENRYNTAGLRIATLVYTDAKYDLSALTPTTALTEAQLNTWAGARTLTKLQRVDYAYDFRGNLSTATAYATTDSSGAGVAAGASVTRYVYDQRGQLLSVIDPRGEATSDTTDFVTSFTYDGLGRQLTKVEWIASGSTRSTITQFNDGLNTTTLTLANGLVATSTYNKAGELISLVNTGPGSAALGTTTYSYDGDGRLRFVTDPTGVRQHVLYDEAGRKVATVDGDGTLTEVVYDRTSHAIKTIVYADRLTAATIATLIDGAGKPTNVTLATLRTSLASVPGRNAAQDKITRAVYDNAGRQVYAIDEVGGVTQLVYDGAGRVTDEVHYATPFVITRTTDQVLPSAVTVTTSANDRRTRYFYDAEGNRVGVLDAAGYLTESIYDAGGLLVQQTAYADATATAQRLTGTLAQLRPAVDNETTVDPERDINSYFFYDGMGRQVGALDGEGYLTETVYDVAGNVSQSIRYDAPLTYSSTSTLASLKAAVPTAAVRHTTSYQYDGVGRLVQQTNFEGTIETYAYDAVNNRTGVTRASGQTDARTTQARYDALGRVTAELTAEGSSLITGGMTQAQIDAVWNQYAARYAYDLAGRRISAIDQNGFTTLFFYDADGRQTHVVNAEGEVIETTYDARGRITGTRTYNTQISTSGLTGGLVSSTLTGRLVVNNTLDAQTNVTYAYNAAGQESTATTAEGASVTHKLNAFGEEVTRVEQVDSTRTLTKTYVYDARGSLKETRWDPTGLNFVETNDYDAFGRRTRAVDANGIVTKTTYDRLGRTLTTVDGLNGTHAITYDAFSRTLTTTDALNNITRYVYDDTLRSVVVTSPENISFTTVHNRFGEQATVTDARGTTTTYVYDLNGKLKTVSDSLGTTLSQTYDRASRLITSTDARGVVTKIDYDSVNRVFTRTVDFGSGNLALATQYRYDDQGRLTDVTEPSGRTTHTTYDRDGRAILLAIDPSGLNLRTAYAYDRAGHVVTVTEGSGSANPRRTQYIYDVLGRRTDEYVDPTSLGGTLNLRTQYKYDANGNVTRKIDALGNSTWYVYDADDRLRYTIDALGSVSEKVYDLEDRVISTRQYATAISTSGFGDKVTSVTVTASAAADELVQSIYDRDGREIYTIDAEGSVIERAYDGDGNVTRARAYAKAVPAGTVYTTASALTSALTTAGNSLTTISADDRVVWSAYDIRNRSVYTVDALGYVVKSVRDGEGNVVTKTEFATARSTSLATDVASLDSWATTGSVPTNADNRTTRYWYDGAGREVFKLDAEGYLTETRYDDAGRKTIAILYRDKPTVAAGATLAQVKANAVVTGFNASRDQVTTTERDLAGRTIRVYDALTTAAATAYEEYGYDAVGNRVTTVDPRGVELAERDSAWAVEYRGGHGYPASSASLLPAQKNSLRLLYTTTSTFDAAGREVTVTDAVGNITRKGYDALGRLVKLTDGRGNTGYTYYDADGRVRYQIDPMGYVTEMRYDALGNKTDEFSYATALTGTWNETTTVASIGTRIVLDATRDRRRTNVYDQRGMVTSITYYGTTGNYTETYTYDAFGQKFTFKDRNNATYDYRYDGVGNLVREILPQTDVVTAVLPNITTSSVRIENRYEYDAFGERVWKREAYGLTGQQRDTHFFYDHRGLQTRIEMPSFVVYDRATNTSTTKTPAIQKSYDSAGNLVLEVAANGGSTVNYYDSRNLRVASVDADNVLSEFTYDAVGNVLRERTYDTRLTGTQVPATRPTPVNVDAYRELTYEYNANNLREVTHTRSEVLFNYALLSINGGFIDTAIGTRASYDANGNVVKTVDGKGYAAYKFYDAAGNCIVQVDPAGAVTRWEYNAQGQVSRETKYSTMLTAAQLGSVSVTSNPTSLLPTGTGDDRITEFDYDKLGRVITERKIGVSYATVNVNSGDLTETSGNLETKYEYDGLGNLTAQVLPNAQGRTDYAYDALGRKTHQYDPTFMAYNGRGVALVSTRSQTDWQYDAFGNVAVETKLGMTAAENRETRSQYDSAGNLRTRRGPEGATVTSDYNVSGNTVRTTRQVTDVDLAAHTYRTYYSYDILNRETQRQDYEDEGTSGQVVRETQDTRYNAHGDIEAKGTNGQFQEKYIYDKLGRLFWTNKESGTPRVYLYDENGNVVLQLSAVNTDLSQVLDGGTLRAIRGPADLRLIQFTSTQPTFNLYDKRNQLIDVFQPPMDFAGLTNWLSVSETGHPGLPGEVPPDIHSVTSVYINGTTYILPGASDTPYAGATPSVTSVWGTVGSPPAVPGPTDTQLGGVTTSDLPALSQGPGTYETLNERSDTTSADGLTRTITERMVRKIITVDIWADGSTLHRRITTTNEDIRRTTVYHRRSTASGDEDTIDQWWYSLPTENLDGSTRTVDIREEVYSKHQIANPTGSFIGTAASYPGQTSLAAAVVTVTAYNYGPAASGVPKFETITLQLPPALMGTGAIRVEVAAANGATLASGTPNSSGVIQLIKEGGTPPQYAQIRIYRDNGLIMQSALNTPPGSTLTIPASAGVAVASIRAQNPSVTRVQMRLLDVNDNPTTGFVEVPVSGGEFRFTGAYDNGQHYEYYAYDAAGNVYNHVKGVMSTTGNATQQNEYQITTTRQNYFSYRPAGLGNQQNFALPANQYTEANNHYLRQLVGSIAEGATQSNVIHRSQSYNAFGEVIRQTDGNGYVTDLSYNELGQLTLEQQPTTGVTNEQGVTSVVRPTTHYYYDELGQLVGTQDANSDLAAAGQKFYNTRIIVNGRVTKEFDARTDATVYSSSYVYDRLGNKRQVFDQMGLETGYTYDRAGQLTRQTRYDSAGAQYAFDTYEYDAAGNRTAHTNTLNNRETYLFDGQNRVRRYTSFENRQTRYDYTYVSTLASGVGGWEKTTTTAAVGGGNDTEIDRTDYFGHIRYHKDIGGHEFTYTYNLAGWLKTQVGTTHDASGRVDQNITYDYYANGYLKSISDTAINSYARFQYDKNGNRTIEAYSQIPITAGQPSMDQYPYQIATATYDELNRLKSVTDPGKFTITYQYDAVGNRRSVDSLYTDLLNQENQHQVFYYTYDHMNRFTTTMGQLVNGAIVRANTGYSITYDGLGRRTFVASDLLDKNGVAQPIRESYTYDPIDTVKETTIRDGNNVLLGRTMRQNDALGNLKDYYEYNAAGAQTKYVHYEYDRDGLTTLEEDRTDMSKRESTVYNYGGSGTLTSTVGRVINASGAQVANTAVVTLSYVYEKWDSYKESVVTISATAGDLRGWQPGSSTYQYDANGHIKKLYDAQAKRTLEYVNNQNGQVLKRYETVNNNPVGLPPQTELRKFYYMNGVGIGDVGKDNAPSRVDYAQSLAIQEKNGVSVHPQIANRVIPVTSADFDQNYAPINPTYPARTASTHIVTEGETLQSIARAEWGDASLWYIIADANGLTDNQPPVAGTRLALPNVVTNIHNNSGTFRPYDVSLALGDTTPTLPDPPAAPAAGGKRGCGVLGMLLIIVVAIVVTVYTAGAASAAIAPATGGASAAAGGAAASGIGATFSAGTAALAGAGGAAGFAGAVIGGAVGAAVSQGVAIAIGAQDGFDWKGVALGAVGAGVGAGLGALATGTSTIGTSIARFASSNPYTFAALNGAASSALTQGISVATGLQKSFSWRDVAVSAVAAPVAKGVGEYTTAFVGDSTVGQLASRTAAGIGGALVRRAFGSDASTASILADAFGSAVGYGIVDAASAISPQQRRVAWARGEDDGGHARRVASGEYVAPTVTPIEPLLTFVSPDIDSIVAGIPMPQINLPPVVPASVANVLEEVHVTAQRQVAPGLNLDSMLNALRRARSAHTTVPSNVRVLDRDALNYWLGSSPGRQRADGQFQALEAFRSQLNGAERALPGEAQVVAAFPAGTSAAQKLENAISLSGGYFSVATGENLLDQINSGADAIDLTFARAESETYLRDKADQLGLFEKAVKTAMMSPHEVSASTIERLYDAQIDQLRAGDNLLPRELTISEPGVQRSIDWAFDKAALAGGIADLLAAGPLMLARRTLTAAVTAPLETAPPIVVPPGTPRTFTSTDPLVADLANDIERAYPGHVVGVGVKYFDSAGKEITDIDILLKNAGIQVKEGPGTGITRQALLTERLTGLPSIAYGPDLGLHVGRNMTKQGILVVRDRQLLIDLVKP